ncbi:uncharacterized protein LOC128212939 [Mya arenaria]|uniref:uncharacterized protein LOC128212939 n=1 Tax=Mya arenaria TaxID=6604 RepID=UPI0022E10417|nr:uncharacterized protein LOC128212939 [Mya arenaria]
MSTPQRTKLLVCKTLEEALRKIQELEMQDNLCLTLVRRILGRRSWLWTFAALHPEPSTEMADISLPGPTVDHAVESMISVAAMKTSTELHLRPWLLMDTFCTTSMCCQFETSLL